MKQIFQNRSIRSFQFTNSVEESAFLERISPKRIVTVDESCGQNSICLVGSNSLTNDVEFVVSFRSDCNEEDLNLVFWNDLMIVDSGKKVFFVGDEIVVRTSIELTSPLIGLYVISDDELLILEETYMQIVDRAGRILRSELFDLITSTTIEKNRLVLQTDSGVRKVDLT